MNNSPQPEQDRRELGKDDIIQAGDYHEWPQDELGTHRLPVSHVWIGFRVKDIHTEARVYRPAPQPEKRCSCGHSADPSGRKNIDPACPKCFPAGEAGDGDFEMLYGQYYIALTRIKTLRAVAERMADELKAARYFIENWHTVEADAAAGDGVKRIDDILASWEKVKHE